MAAAQTALPPVPHSPRAGSLASLTVLWCSGALVHATRYTRTPRKLTVHRLIMAARAALALLAIIGSARGAQYYGKEVGALSELHHGVRGRVFAVDARTLYLQDFTYDGVGPAAYFYVGKSKRVEGGVGAGAVRLRDERGGAAPLRRYRGEGVTLALPDGATLHDYSWLTVWCDDYSVSFGDVMFPGGVEYPRPAKLGALRGVHGVSSDAVVVVDAQTLLVPNFSYDGEAPDAKFWVGRGASPSPQGIRIPDENGKEAPLRRYDRKTLVLTLPGELTVFDIGHFGVWCEAFTVDFGHVTLPAARVRSVPPSLRMLGVSPQSGPSSPAPTQVAARAPATRRAPIAAVDATTYRPSRARPVPAPAPPHELHRRADAHAPAATQLLQPEHDRHPNKEPHLAPPRLHPSQHPAPQLSPESLHQFRLYEQQRLLQLRLLNEQFPVQYQYQPEPQQYRFLPYHYDEERAAAAGQAAVTSGRVSIQRSVDLDLNEGPSKLNCEVLNDELAFEVRWAVAGDSIVLQLVAKLEEGEYMSFGISGDETKSQMVGGDVAVTWVDQRTLQGYAQDYYLDAKSQCAGVRGACPDVRLVDKTNSVRLLNAALVNGYSIVTYQRSLRAADELDRRVRTNVSESVIWAIGPLNDRQEVSYHHHYNKDAKFIEFGRAPLWNCPMPEGDGDERPTTAAPAHTHHNKTTAPAVIRPNPVPTPAAAPAATAWEVPPVQCDEPADGVFYAQMGPTGGKQGYPAITGHVGWGTSWYINGLLIPEITVVRGKKYTFVVEGGNDPEVPAKYHPFYITNDPIGGYHHKNDKEKEGVQIYAGVRRSRVGALMPTGVGRLCSWTPDLQGPEADEYPSFGAYQRSLTLVCEEGSPGVVTWTPDKNTPDTVYYQCFTHRHLGWKINVVDECDLTEVAEESRVVETLALPDDLQEEESIQVQSRIRPDVNFLDHRKKLEKIINTKLTYDGFSSNSHIDDGLLGEVMHQPEPNKNQIYHGQEYELPVSKVQIKEVIEAVESLENKMMHDMKRNLTHLPLNQYQAQEQIKEFFLPEHPITEEDEFVIDTEKFPEKHLLPTNQRPLTLQTVLRPNGSNGKTKDNTYMRPHFRRPVPPEIKLRRPPSQSQLFQKVSNVYPLPMPNPHGPYYPQKKQSYKPGNNRHQNINNMNRPPLPPMNSVPPMKFMPPLPHGKPGTNQLTLKPTMKIFTGPATNQAQTIVLGKPANNVQMPIQSQTLSLGQADFVVNQIVKSQITLPGVNDPVVQHSSPQTYISKPGQIILGKPIETPSVIDQQMIHSSNFIIRSTPTPVNEQYTSTTLKSRLNNDKENELVSSDFVGESMDTSTIHPAVNTGFKPDSIVIESGFKPIIREPLMAGEDKIADYNGNNSNRREDTDIEIDYEEAPQPILNTVNKISSDKLTQTFEPMFIPSPPDHIISTNDKTKEVFPSNHAKEDRPHPVYVKTENELNALFGKKNLERHIPSDMVMESDKVSPHYLPPDPKHTKENLQTTIGNEETFSSFDGKTLSATTLTSVPDVKKITKLFSSKLPASDEVLLSTPQFGPFKGEIPASLQEMDRNSHQDNKEADLQTTNLKLVNSYRKSVNENSEELKAESNLNQNVTAAIDSKQEEKDEEGEDYEEEDESQEESKKR